MAALDVVDIRTEKLIPIKPKKNVKTTPNTISNETSARLISNIFLESMNIRILALANDVAPKKYPIHRIINGTWTCAYMGPNCVSRKFENTTIIIKSTAITGMLIWFVKFIESFSQFLRSPLFTDSLLF